MGAFGPSAVFFGTSTSVTGASNAGAPGLPAGGRCLWVLFFSRSRAKFCLGPGSGRSPAFIGEFSAPDLVVDIIVFHYLEKEQVRGLLTRVHQAFEGREAGLFLGDVVITPEPLPTALRVLRAILRLVSGGRVERHFHDNDEAQLAMEAAGFGYVRVHDPADHRGLFPPRAEAPVDALRVVEACY